MNMASTIHKPVDVRRTRRQRYIAPINHFRERYNCTAAEVYGVVIGIEKDNTNLKERLDDLVRENERLNKRVVALRQKLLDAGIDPDN